MAPLGGEEQVGEVTVVVDVQHSSPFGAYAAETNPVVAAVMPPDGV